MTDPIVRTNDERMADGTYRVRCMVCGKSVSSPLPDPVTVRAWVICPECIERHGVDGGAMRTGVPLSVRAVERMTDVTRASRR
jgi:hypothetical protein